MTLTTDLVLATLDPETGKTVIDMQRLRVAVAGAAVVELVDAKALRLTGPDESGHKPGRLVRTGDGEPTEPHRLDALERADGHKPKTAIARIGGGQTFKDRAGDLRDLLLGELEHEGTVRRREEKVLGVVPTTRWQVDAVAHAAVVRRVEAALLEGAAPPATDAALASLLHAVGALPKVVRSRDKAWLKARGAVVSRGDWGTAAVAAAVRDVQAAVIAAVTASVSAAGAAG